MIKKVKITEIEHRAQVAAAITAVLSRYLSTRRKKGKPKQ